MIKSNALAPDRRPQCSVTCKTSLITIWLTPPKTPPNIQIPIISYTSRNNERKPPAVSSPEACPTPAGRGRRRQTVEAGVRQTLTKGVLLGLVVKCRLSDQNPDVTSPPLDLPVMTRIGPAPAD